MGSFRPCPPPETTQDEPIGVRYARDITGARSSVYGPFFVAAVFVAALAVYLLTAPRGLTWAHDSADGGDLIAAALVGGVPHPTGYPTYMLLARLWLGLPWGTPAWRVTLLSAVSGATAAALVTAALHELWAVQPNRQEPPAEQVGVRDKGKHLQAAGPSIPTSGSLDARAIPLTEVDPDANTTRYVRSWAALAAGLMLAFTPLLWGQSTVAEVYALQGALSAALIWTLARWQRLGRWTWAALAGLIWGLALGNHLTSVWLLPLALTWLARPTRRAGSSFPFARRFAALIAFALGAGTGLLVYLYLPLAARGQPPVNWGDPRTPAGFWWLVSGQLYRPYVLAVDGPNALARLAAWAGLLWRDFLPWGVALAGLGLAAQRTMTMAWSGLPTGGAVLSVLLGLGWAVGYNTSDSYLTLLPSWVLLALWAGLGLGAVGEWLALRLRSGRWLAPLLCLALSLVPLIRYWPSQDLHREREAEDFLAYVLQATAPQTLLITIGDRATFSLWYGRYGLGQRPDLTPVSRDLWRLKSYRATVATSHPWLADGQPPASLASLIERVVERRPVYLVQVGEQTPDPASLGLSATVYQLEAVRSPVSSWHLARLVPAAAAE